MPWSFHLFSSFDSFNSSNLISEQALPGLLFKAVTRGSYFCLGKPSVSHVELWRVGLYMGPNWVGLQCPDAGACLGNDQVRQVPGVGTENGYVILLGVRTVFPLQKQTRTVRFLFFFFQGQTYSPYSLFFWNRPRLFPHSLCLGEISGSVLEKYQDGFPLSSFLGSDQDGPTVPHSLHPRNRPRMSLPHFLCPGTVQVWGS